ncbi:hypothetical protein OS42_31520 [Dickeya oryzae]
MQPMISLPFYYCPDSQEGGKETKICLTTFAFSGYGVLTILSPPGTLSFYDAQNTLPTLP